jgi:hypothetical protein
VKEYYYPTSKINSNKWLAILLCIQVHLVFAQDTKKDLGHTIAFETQFHQLKEGHNYGRVFNGLLLGVDYKLVQGNEVHSWAYSAGLGFGPSYKIGLGLCWTFKPGHFQYLFKLKESKFWLGPYASINYSWQLYPELQSGHMFWNTSFEMGSMLEYHPTIKNRKLTFKLGGAILGLNSRPDYPTEVYHYSLTVKDYVSNAHKNLEPVFSNSYNHVQFAVILNHKEDKKLSLGYSFEYVGRLKSSRFTFINHSFNLIWSIQKNEK